MSGIHDIKFTPPQGGATRAAFNSFLDPAGAKDGVAPVELEWAKVGKALNSILGRWNEAVGRAMAAAQRAVQDGHAKPEDPVQVAMTINWYVVECQLAPNNAMPTVKKPEAFKGQNDDVILQLYTNALIQKIKEGFAVGEWDKVKVTQLANPSLNLNNGSDFLAIEAVF